MRFEFDPALLFGHIEEAFPSAAAASGELLRAAEPVRTGALRAGTNVAMSGPLSAAVSVEGPARQYAGIVDRGARPHDEEASSAGAMSWGGARHPVKRVRHPGSRGRGFLARLVPAFVESFTARLRAL